MRQSKKALLIKISALLIALFLFVAFYFWQERNIIRIELSEDTLIRNGHHMVADSGLHTYLSTNPHYSIYIDIISIGPRDWHRMTELGLFFAQARVGDQIYIESVSVKQPFFASRHIDNRELFDSMAQHSNAEIAVQDDGKIMLSAAGKTPGFYLPREVLKAAAAPDPIFLCGILALLLAGAAIILYVPDRLYALAFNKALNYLKSFKDLRLHIAAFFLLLIFAIFLYNFGDRFRFLRGSEIFGSVATQIAALAAVFILFFIFIRHRRIGFAEEKEAPIRPLACYILLLALSLAVYVPAMLTSPYFHHDENYVAEAAMQYLEHGVFQVSRYGALDKVTPYSRAWMHTWLVAQAFNLFGFSTFSARAVSVFFGVAFILSSFYIIKNLAKRTDLALLTAILLLFNAQLIEIFTTVRMYALMMPLSLWMLYFIFKALHCEITYKSDNAATRWISRRFNFHFGYAALAIVFIMLNNHIMRNALILLFGVAIYIFWKAIEERRPKFVTLSIVGAAALLGIGTCFFAHIVLSVRIPGISPYISSFLNYSSFGWNNMIYFWDNADIPLSPFLGVLLLLAGLAFCMANRRANPFFLFASLCYLSTVVFFVFFADRYYTYRYMAFVAPVSVALISLGHCAFASKMSSASRRAFLLVLLFAIFGHMAGTFPQLYIDPPYRTGYNRPLQIIKNTAKNYGLEPVPVYVTLVRPTYFDAVIGDLKVHPLEFFWATGLETFERQADVRPDFDYLLTVAEEDPIVFYFAESPHYWFTSPTHRFFLENAVDLVTTIDNSIVQMYNFVAPAHMSASAATDSAAEDGAAAEGGGAFRIMDVEWEGDVAYLHCELGHADALSGAKLICVEVVEQGLSQSATHRYQVLAPEGFERGDALRFALTVRPKTDEYSEDIVFYVTDSAYIYYGEDAIAVIELAG